MRFLLDVMCGRLATYLRMCGYDAAYALDRGVEADDEVLALARDEDRILVTRDEGLAARREGSILLGSLDIEGQLRELGERGIELSLGEPARCSRCNAPVERVPEGASVPEYAPSPVEEAVWRCSGCGQHYWRGSHWDDVAARLDSL